MVFNSSFLDPDRSSRQKWAKIINVWKVLLISSNLVIQGELYIEQKKKTLQFSPKYTTVLQKLSGRKN